MDPDKTEENGDNNAADDQNDLFPEISDYKPEELDLDFLSSQERPENLFPPIPEQEAPPASSTPHQPLSLRHSLEPAEHLKGTITRTTITSEQTGHELSSGALYLFLFWEGLYFLHFTFLKSLTKKIEPQLSFHLR